MEQKLGGTVPDPMLETETIVSPDRARAANGNHPDPCESGVEFSANNRSDRLPDVPVAKDVRHITVRDAFRPATRDRLRISAIRHSISATID